VHLGTHEYTDVIGPKQNSVALVGTAHARGKRQLARVMWKNYK